MYKIRPITSNAEIQTKGADKTSGISVFGRQRQEDLEFKVVSGG